MFLRQVEDGCTAWRLTTKTRAGILLRRQTLTLGVRPSPDPAAVPLHCQSVTEVVARVVHEAARVQPDGHRVSATPYHTESDHRVSLCAACKDRPGEARVAGRWVCGVCVPLDDAIGRAVMKGQL